MQQLSTTRPSPDHLTGFTHHINRAEEASTSVIRRPASVVGGLRPGRLGCRRSEAQPDRVEREEVVLARVGRVKQDERADSAEERRGSDHVNILADGLGRTYTGVVPSGEG